MKKSTRLTILTALLAAAALLATTFAAGPAGAIVPPKICAGYIKVSGKRYKIKADQLPCSKAKDYSVTYLKTHRAPRYYKCFSYAGSNIKAQCQAKHYNPDRTFWIIKH